MEGKTQAKIQYAVVNARADSREIDVTLQDRKLNIGYSAMLICALTVIRRLRTTPPRHTASACDSFLGLGLEGIIPAA